MKSFRDPVHNLIAFGDADRLIVELINTKEMQRLRRIRQLGMSNIAYPGAEHSRFVHSLGVAHLMRRFLDTATQDMGNALAQELRDYRTPAIAAALLHDVGHGPFSHALESVTEERHERWTTAILRSPQTEVHQALESEQSGLSEIVAQIIEKTFRPSRAVVKLLSSQLDMDRTDYLLRDAMMTGAGYGSFDVEWLLHVMRIGEVDGDLEVGLDLEKGKSIAEDYIMCRYYMYLHVYYHHTTRAAEVLIEKLLHRARCVQAYLPGFGALNALLAGQLQASDEGSVAKYLALDDAMLWTAMHLWSEHEDAVLRDLSSRLLHRRILYGIDVKDEAHADRILEQLRLVADRHHLPFESYVQYDQAASHAYKDEYVGEGTAARGSENIYLFDREGTAHELSRESFLVEAVRGRRARVERVLCPLEWLDGVDVQ